MLLRSQENGRGKFTKFTRFASLVCARCDLGYFGAGHEKEQRSEPLRLVEQVRSYFASYVDVCLGWNVDIRHFRYSQCGTAPISNPVLSCRAYRSTMSALARL